MCLRTLSGFCYPFCIFLIAILNRVNEESKFHVQPYFLYLPHGEPYSCFDVHACNDECESLTNFNYIILSLGSSLRINNLTLSIVSMFRQVSARS